jgi:hypothetical protein
MVQGAEFDLIDIRFYTQTSDVDFVQDNEPVQDLNTNVLIIDDKAILARNTATQADTDFTAHQGAGGPIHANGTTLVAGFLSVADKVKLDQIDTEAQLNILPPTDALELVGRGTTVLHEHPEVTDSAGGYMSVSLKSKLDGIQTGAQVNNITQPQADLLTAIGGVQDANSLHSHVTPVFVETFDAGDHAATDHTGLPGVVPFSGLTKSTFAIGPSQTGPGITIWNRVYSFTPHTVAAGFAEIKDFGGWGLLEAFTMAGISISQPTKTVTISIQGKEAGAGGDFLFRAWQMASGE